MAADFTPAAMNLAITGFRRPRRRRLARGGVRRPTKAARALGCARRAVAGDDDLDVAVVQPVQRGEPGRGLMPRVAGKQDQRDHERDACADPGLVGAGQQRGGKSDQGQGNNQ